MRSLTGTRVRAWASALGAGAVFSALTAAAFPPVGLWGLVFLAPMPLIWAGVRGRDGLGPALPVALGALPLWAYEQSWVSQVSIAGYPPMILTLAGLSGLFAWILAAVVRWMPALPLSLVVPVAWAGAEFFRGEVFFGGLPWLLLAHPTIDAPLFPATASLLGTYFTSFLVSIPAAAAADLLLVRPRRARPALIAIGTLAGCLALAQLTTVAPGPPGELRIAVVQTNIPQDNKMDWEVEQRLRDFARFAELTRKAAAASPPPHLIVWPETMFPGEVLDPESVEAQRRANLARTATLPDGREVQVPVTYFADELNALQEELGIPILVGAMATANLRFQEQPDGGFTASYDARYNSAFLVEGGRVRPERYDKMALAPFGEEMPYISLWPWLERRLLALGASGMTFDLVAGRNPVGFDIPTGAGPVRVVTPICFEATRAGHCRRLLNSPGPEGRRAAVMVNLTNDGWFGGFDPARRQHLQIARWRCAELRRPMVRAANTGVSCHIDSRGRLVRLGVDGGGPAARADGLLTTSVRVPGEGATIFARLGGVFAWLVLVATALLAAGSLRARIKARRAGMAATRFVAGSPPTAA